MSGIYLHIPFCNTKCIYCDFYSITDHSRKDEYIDCMVKEIIDYSKILQGKSFNTIFFGGGTPSLLSKCDFEKLFDVLYSNLNISSESEITIEANPGTLDKTKLKEFKTLPINRISFGVQSFFDDKLKFLSRIHNSEQAISSIKFAQDAGYTNINLDLIFAIPHQTFENWQYNLEKAILLDVQHISAYSLIFEQGTPLYSLYEKKKVLPLDTELERDMYDLTMEYLSSHGFIQYEISNYAKPGYECKHNLKYWEHKEYVGFGPSAASFLNNYRKVNIRNLDKYIEKIKNNIEPQDFVEFIDKDTSIYEYIMLGLRSKGVNFNSFKEQYNIDFKTKYNETINMLTREGLAESNSHSFHLTSKGYVICDEILSTYF